MALNYLLKSSDVFCNSITILNDSSITSCNDVTTAGVYRVTSTITSNRPIADTNAILIVLGTSKADDNGNPCIVQVYVLYNNATYLRVKWYSNSWTSWQQII